MARPPVPVHCLATHATSVERLEDNAEGACPEDLFNFVMAKPAEYTGLGRRLQKADIRRDEVRVFVARFNR